MAVATQTMTEPKPLYEPPTMGTLKLRGHHMPPQTSFYPELDSKGVSRLFACSCSHLRASNDRWSS